MMEDVSPDMGTDMGANMRENMLSESFETYRTYLFAIAYRMLGSAMDAEDMVQETYIRYQAAVAHQHESQEAAQPIRSLKAYLTTILTRLCIDQLDLAHRKRELYAGPWLPEPLLTDAASQAGDPQQRLETEESVSLAFLVLLEQLQPFERAVFLLREVFDYDFAEIALMLAKSEAATRRSFSRAKAHLRAHRPRFPASRQTQQQLLDGYVQAVETGAMEPLMNLLAEDVTLWADGGGKVKNAALRPVSGREAVARFSLGTNRFRPPAFHLEQGEANGEPAVLLYSGDQLFSILTVEVEAGLIRAIRIVANPEKLARANLILARRG